MLAIFCRLIHTVETADVLFHQMEQSKPFQSAFVQHVKLGGLEYVEDRNQLGLLGAPLELQRSIHILAEELQYFLAQFHGVVGVETDSHQIPQPIKLL